MIVCVCFFFLGVDNDRMIKLITNGLNNVSLLPLSIHNLILTEIQYYECQPIYDQFGMFINALSANNALE